MTALAKSQAHEQAFRRWSVPAAEEVAPTESGVSEIAPPSSFRVYSPEETRLAPLRPAHRPSTRGVTDELASSLSLAASSPRMLLKWLGIGVAIGTLVLTACVLVISLTDDPGRPATKTTSLVRMVVPHPAPPPATTTAAVTTDPNESSGADFELPDDPQPGAARTPTKRTAKAKPRLAVRDVPF